MRRLPDGPNCPTQTGSSLMRNLGTREGAVEEENEAPSETLTPGNDQKNRELVEALPFDRLENRVGRHIPGAALSSNKLGWGASVTARPFRRPGNAPTRGSPPRRPSLASGRSP